MKIKQPLGRADLPELYRIISAPLVIHPDDLLIHTQGTLETCTVVVECNPEDQGRLIGAGGKMYKACDYLIRITGARFGVGARLIIETDFRSTHELRPFNPNHDWNQTDNERLEGLLRAVMGYVWDSPVEIQTSDVSKHGTVVLMRTRDDLDDRTRTSIETIINAVGKANGRFVYLETARIYADERQNLRARRASSR